MIIELIGLPGSGKSHISCLLADSLRKAGLPAEEPTRVIGHSSGLKRIAAKNIYVLLFLLRHPLLTVRTKLAVARTRQTTCRDLFKSLFNMLFLRGLLLSSRNRSRLVLLDQGLIQAVASVHFGAARRLTGSFLSTLPTPDLVIRVAASPGTLVARLTSRSAGGGSRVEADPAAELPRFEAALESLAGQLPLSGAEIIEITNDGDDEALVRDLYELVRRIAEVYNARN